jgi:putative NADPH-quinone reductase
VVFVTPIYYWGFTAQLKTAWDRFYTYGKPEGKKRIAIQESALLICLGDTDDATYRHAAGTYRDIIDYVGWKDRGIIAATGMNGRQDILKSEALLKAEALGGALGGAL